VPAADSGSSGVLSVAHVSGSSAVVPAAQAGSGSGGILPVAHVPASPGSGSLRLAMARISGGSAVVPSNADSGNGIPVPVARVSGSSAVVPAGPDTGGGSVPVSGRSAAVQPCPESGRSIPMPVARFSGSLAVFPAGQESGSGVGLPVARISGSSAMAPAGHDSKPAPFVRNTNSFATPHVAQGSSSYVPLRIEEVQSIQGSNSYAPPPAAQSSSSFVPPARLTANRSFVPLPVAQAPVLATATAAVKQPSDLTLAPGRASSLCAPSLPGSLAATASSQAVPKPVVAVSGNIAQAVPKVASGFTPQAVGAVPVFHPSRAPSPIPCSRVHMPQSQPQHSSTSPKLGGIVAPSPSSLHQPAWAMSNLGGAPVVASVGSSLVASPMSTCRSITPHRKQVPSSGREPFRCLTNSNALEGRAAHATAFHGRENTAPENAPPPPWLLKAAHRAPRQLAACMGATPVKSPPLAGAVGCGSGISGGGLVQQQQAIATATPVRRVGAVVGVA